MFDSPNGRVLRSFLHTRWLAVKLRSRTDLNLHQQSQMKLWKAHVSESFPQYDPNTLRMSKASLMADFAAFNQERLTAAEVRRGLPSGYVHPDVACGMSTGTSGNRGLYVITQAERYQWLGVILAKALPEVWRTRQRVAVILPQNSALYQAGNQSRLLRVEFFDLRSGPEQWVDELLQLNPTVLVAPPKILSWLARNTDLDRLTPRRIFSAAETLDAPDRAEIEAAFGLRLGQIYMATEGLLGVTCRKGTLHLTEDYVKFSFDWVSNELASPVITDFSRRYQLIAGYEMNDLLRVQDQPCACGSPLQPVAEVVGRRDDVFWFGDVMVTPDILRNAVLDTDARITDFRIQQTHEGRVILRLPSVVPDEIKAKARAALSSVLRGRGVEAEISFEALAHDDLFTRKLRRVERLRT